MRPKNKRGKRWFYFISSPKFEGFLQHVLLLREARRMADFTPLPDGLPIERYIERRAELLQQFDQRIAAQLREASENREQITAQEIEGPAQHKQSLLLSTDSQVLLDARAIMSEIIRKIKENPTHLKQIDHRKFEELVAYLFEIMGYEVELTKKTRDGGRDIVAVRNEMFMQKYLVECKHWPNRTIGVSPIRELYGVKIDEGATKAVIATTSVLSADAKLFIERHKWEMEAKEYDSIVEWVQSI